jgi:hypothetical protein
MGIAIRMWISINIEPDIPALLSSSNLFIHLCIDHRSWLWQRYKHSPVILLHVARASDLYKAESYGDAQ